MGNDKNVEFISCVHTMQIAHVLTSWIRPWFEDSLYAISDASLTLINQEQSCQYQQLKRKEGNSEFRPGIK